MEVPIHCKEIISPFIGERNKGIFPYDKGPCSKWFWGFFPLLPPIIPPQTRGNKPPLTWEHPCWNPGS